jgi:fatty-acyl-CoA synthase
MVISGGENVYPAEIERCLTAHPAIREVAVLGVADERWGEVGRAFCVLHEGQALDLDTLRAFCDGKLARYKIPRHLTVVGEIPRNAAGKVDQATLRSLARTP